MAVLLLLAVILFCGAYPVAADQKPGASFHRFELGSGLSGFIDLEGGLVFQPADSGLPLLTTELVAVTDSRRRRSNADPFFELAAEGVENGHRGFSSLADDDQDGLIDEDRLDGIDNDRDGKIDEDFAAISDAMVAVHLQQRGAGQSGTQLEYYHWSSACLNSAVFLNVGGGTEARSRGTYRIQSAGPRWLEAEVRSLGHNSAGRSAQDGRAVFVSHVALSDQQPAADPCLPGSGLWLGVMILDDEPSARFRVEDDRLDLPLSETQVPLVICAAESWLQLNRFLSEARNIYEGVVDPVDNRRIRWITPPKCSNCRGGDPLGIAVDTRPDGGLTLTTEVHAGQCGLPDPDLFLVGGRSLGAPREIRWLPAEGSTEVIPWTCMTPERIENSARSVKSSAVSLAELLGQETGGRLEFVFDPPQDIFGADVDRKSDVPVEVIGRYLDGSLLQFSLAPVAAAAREPEVAPVKSLNPESDSLEEAARGYAEDRERLLKSGQYQPSLSPELLKGWPNPFNDIISIRFTVPRTMKEAFIWKSLDNQPLEIELEGDVPWSGGQPGVSVKIYSINGQELVTIHSGTEGPGEYTAQWNGTDAFGRKVASGTYFCKLQMDDWSVTRRLVFIR